MTQRRAPLPRYEDVYGSQYVSPDDFHGGKTVTVKIVDLEHLELTCVKGGRPQKNMKIVATCDGCKKKLAINKTSAKRLAMAWGKDFTNWIGKSIQVGGGEVNGRPATLVTPVKGPGEPTPPANEAEDLSFHGDIPESGAE